MAIPHSLRALRSPNFRRYYTGQAVSMIGTWVQSVALMWLAYRLTGSTWFTGLVGFLQSVERSKHFVTIDSVGLSQAGTGSSGSLSIAFTTYFRREPGDLEDGAR